MYSVTFGFFGTETHDNWTWLMENLRKAIGDPPLLAVSSDACRGLANVVKAVFAHVEQRECFKHLMENYVKRFGDAEHMYPAARAYRKVVHEHHKAIAKHNSYVCYWLDEYHPLLWYRSGFNPTIKYDYVTNNMTESFNN
jgi:transposase-like protein